ncbi:DUF2577 domain-containing protein [Paenibacillus periandrae]|uniref:DUF2577 domain-containing protein n=1 Tax=Paenibacillus periandrae TaxID=1761741 RepID=UPI001F098731|nr:DUF2577 domain-containing protein [Paenibacillus periandrae]
MDRILNIIKQAGSGAVEAGNPVNILFGNVTSSNPLEVNVDQRFTLSEDFLIIPESLTAFTIELNHQHSYQDAGAGGDGTRSTDTALMEPIVIRRGLEAGDKVLLVRMQGGQQFIVLDRVVQP